VAPFSGSDGTIYAPRTQNNPTTDYLVAFKDTGSGFVEKWRVPLGYVPFASFGVAPDGSVYSYSRSNRVIRIEPSTGTILDSSEVIVSDFYQPRMAVDSHGFVFLTNGGFSQGALYAFIENLSPLWPAPEPIANVNVGGPALGQFGVLIVCGVGTDVRAYQFWPDVVEEQPAAVKDLPLTPGLVQNYPNPFNATTIMTFRLNKPGFTNLVVFDALGREVVRLVSERLTPGIHQVSFDGSRLSSGTYFYRLSVGEFVETKKLTLLR
jgi:hypothetical protein